MTQLSTFGGVVLPSPAEAAVVPADFVKVINQLTGTALNPAKVNAVVSSQAERDANYDGYPAGGLVVCPQAQTIWMSLGKGTGVQLWKIVYYDSGWITDGFVYNTSWAPVSAGLVKARRVNNTMNLRVRAVWSGADIQADSNSGSRPGNIVDNTVLTSVPSDFVPVEEQVANFRAQYTGGTALLGTTGAVALVDMHTNSAILSGGSIQTQFWWFAEN